MSPTDAEPDGFDVLVVDIQDVGLRFYTYCVSMYYLMDACAAAGKEVVILDRPNPNGFYVGGPAPEEGLFFRITSASIISLMHTMLCACHRLIFLSSEVRTKPAAVELTISSEQMIPVSCKIFVWI